MKLRERAEAAEREAMRYREALGYVVRQQKITWLDQRMVSVVSGMPPRMLRLGLIESSDPMIVVHEVDSLQVSVRTPNQVADWNFQAIIAFQQELAQFLVNHADTDGGTTDFTHVPSWSWRQHVAATERSIAEATHGH